ncbi:MAG: ABC transporter ATP-binding protein [Candidatus Heimdallarchaeota archaeon]|nr:ABC transporter ATP-binding protein [Candidatus Heimdallarchaeota archaeon]
MLTNNESDHVLIVEKICFHYNKSKPVIEEIDMHIDRGEIIGISGENGSGKSTLLKLLVGLLSPKSGSIKSSGRIGYSPQDVIIFDYLTVKENFQVFGKGMKLSNKEIQRQSLMIMEKLRFSEYENELVKNLSGGTAQKVNFGISLLGDPDLLILDEPYQGMDYSSFLSFWDIQNKLRNEGKSIIIVSHLLEDRTKFTRNLHLMKGRLNECVGDDCDECKGI